MNEIMTIDDMIATLQEAKKKIGGDKPVVPLVIFGKGDEDSIINHIEIIDYEVPFVEIWVSIGTKDAEEVDD